LRRTPGRPEHPCASNDHREGREGSGTGPRRRCEERQLGVIGPAATTKGKARFVAADLEKAAEVARLAKEAGVVDILVNNAGLALFGPTAQFEVDRFDAMFASNVRAPFLLVAALAPGMVSRGRGNIVSIGSMAGAIGLAGGAAYGATKAARAAMTRAWTAEFAANGVRATNPK
jgi:short-subunit dehydrogenase